MRVLPILDNPQPASLVEVQEDGLFDGWFMEELFKREVGWNGEGLQRLGRCQSAADREFVHQRLNDLWGAEDVFEGAVGGDGGLVGLAHVRSSPVWNSHPPRI